MLARLRVRVLAELAIGADLALCMGAVAPDEALTRRAGGGDALGIRYHVAVFWLGAHIALVRGITTVSLDTQVAADGV